MLKVQEGKLQFSFPNELHAVKYDALSFVTKIAGSIQPSFAIDFIYLGKQHEIVLLEIKDFRHSGARPDRLQKKHEEKVGLGTIIAWKVRDTLAGMVAGKLHDNEQLKPILTQLFSQNSARIKCLLLIEGLKTSRLHNNTVTRANLQQELKTKLHTLHIRVKVYSLDSLPADLPWSVQQLQQKE